MKKRTKKAVASPYTFSKSLSKQAEMFPDTNLKPRVGAPVVVLPNVLTKEVTRQTYFNVSQARKAEQSTRARVYTSDGTTGAVSDTTRRTDIYRDSLMHDAEATYATVETLVNIAARESWGVGELVPCSKWWLAGYGVGDRFTAHCDGAIMLGDGTYKAVENRLISAIVYMNPKDSNIRGWGYSGGELIFPGIVDVDGVPLTIHPREGDLVVFPSSYVYTHEVPFITDGYRVAATNFFKLK